MDAKEIIQKKLDARQKLATMNREELVALSKNPEEFDRFIDGFSRSMSSVFVCYAYQYNDIIREMISNNMDRLEGNDDLSQRVHFILHHFDSFGKESEGYRREFFYQFEAVEAQCLHIDKLGLGVKDLDKVAATYFKRMTNLEMDSMRSDKNYLATVSYLVKYHPEYMTYSYMLPEIQKTLSHVEQKDFASKDEYKAFKKVANKTMNRISKEGHRIRKERVKTLGTHSGYKW